MRRPILALRVAVAIAGVTAGVTAVAAPATAAVPVVVIDGRGYGHGVGMAQDGALAMGRQGASLSQILSQFYPGTRLGKAGGEVRVVVAGPAGGPLALAFPGGGEIRDARSGGQSAGFPVAVPAGGQVRVRFDGGRYHLEAAATARPAAAAPSAAPP
ncbi:MAG: hypothetical protein ACRD1K_06730, partial [Acidimicrobiales bacterium]